MQYYVNHLDTVPVKEKSAFFTTFCLKFYAPDFFRLSKSSFEKKHMNLLSKYKNFASFFHPGANWMILWSLSHCLAMSVAKLLDIEISTLLLVLFRSFIGILILMPSILKKTIQLKSTLLSLHSLRSFFNILSMLCTYEGYRRLDLSVATCVGFCGPLISSSLAVFFYKEKLNKQKTLALVTGYFGILIISKPGFSGNFDPNIFYILLANFWMAISILITKKISVKDSPQTIVAYSQLGVFAFACIMIAFFYPTHSLHLSPQYIITNFSIYFLLKHSLLFLMIAAFAVLSQFCYAKAISKNQITEIAPYEYCRLIFTIPVGFLLFLELPQFNQILGSFFIIISSLILNQKTSLKVLTQVQKKTIKLDKKERNIA